MRGTADPSEHTHNCSSHMCFLNYTTPGMAETIRSVREPISTAGAAESQELPGFHLEQSFQRGCQRTDAAPCSSWDVGQWETGSCATATPPVPNSWSCSAQQRQQLTQGCFIFTPSQLGLLLQPSRPRNVYRLEKDSSAGVELEGSTMKSRR